MLLFVGILLESNIPILNLFLVMYFSRSLTFACSSPPVTALCRPVLRFECTALYASSPLN